MKNLTKDKIKTNYTPLVKQFLEEVKDLRLAKISALHLPVVGRNYDKANQKILFIGIDTNSGAGLKTYIVDAIESFDSAFEWFDEAFKEFKFLGWNSRRGFWDFNMQLLARLNEKISKQELDYNKFYETP